MDAGQQALTYFQQSPEFGPWMEKAGEWKDIIGGRNVLQIEESCRGQLGLAMSVPFELQVCSNMILEPSDDSFTLPNALLIGAESTKGVS